MNNKTIAGIIISALSAVLLIFHIIHLADTVKKFGDDGKEKAFKNAPVYLIRTDSTGKKDTLRFDNYMKKEK